MKKTTYFKSLLLAAGLCVGASAWAQTAPTDGAAVSTGDYYIYNLATGKYLNKGVASGTHSDLDGAGCVITISGTSDAYLLHFDGISDGLYFGTDGYVDKATDNQYYSTWSFESAGTVTGYTNVYKIKANANSGYLYWANATGNPWQNETWLSDTFDFTGENANYGYWILIPKATREAYAAASLSNYIDATWRMKDPDFEGYNPGVFSASTIWSGDFIMNAYSKTPYSGMFYEKWAGEVDGATNGIGTLQENGNYHLNDYSEYQTLSGLPLGKYRLSAAGEAVQQGSGAEDGLTGYSLYAGSEQTLITTSGTYTVDFIATGADVQVGVKTVSTTANWVSVDNFRLAYIDPYVSAIAEAFTNGSTLTANTWYYYDAPLPGSYSVEAETLTDIIYTTNGDQLKSVADALTDHFSASDQTISTRYYFMSTSAQELTFTPNASQTYDFQNGIDPFVNSTAGSANKMSKSIADDATLNSKVLKFQRSDNSNGYAFSRFDFSDLMDNASAVSVEFDFYVSQGAGHNVISLADADYHYDSTGEFNTGTSNTGYGKKGAVFNFGCFRANSNNYWGVNSVQGSSATGLNAWYHAKVEVDLTSKKVTYKITEVANSETVLAQGSDISFMNGSAQTCSQIDVYLGGVSKDENYALIDNLSITPTVDESTHSYTINAVTSTGTTITAIASGMCAEGESYGTIVKKVISDGVNYYVLDDNGLTDYSASYTMGTSDETREVKYTLDDEIVFYYEGGDLGETTTYSYGNVGYIGQQNYRCRGISVGALSAGQYEIESYFTANADWGVCVRDKYINNGNESANSLCLLTGNLNEVIRATFSLESDLATSCINAKDLPDGVKTYNSATFDYIIIRKTSDLPATVSGSITDCGWSTFASNYNLDLSGVTNGTAYYASAATGSTVTLTSCNDKIIGAGTGIMVKGTAGATFTIPVTASDATFSATNYLKGQTETGEVAASTSGAYHYVFGYSKTNSSEYGFYNLASATEVAAGKAYLETTTALTTAGARLAIVFDDEATGIQTVNSEGVKVKGYYDLSGRRVTNPQKGLYIVNGKKVIIK